MPRFEPFTGVLYDTERLDLAEVTAPPYDVIDDDERAVLGARSPWNVVHIDLPAEEGGRDRYENACHLLHQWLDEGVLVTDDEPAFYVYRMGYHDEAGMAHQTSGVIGALELLAPGAGDIYPHEQTTPKAHSDRLQMLRSCRANLSAVWGLSLTPGLGALCELPGPPIARWTDDDGVHHRLYRVGEPGVIDAIRSAVAASPVVIADGHHRYSTSLAYRDERNESGGPPEMVMAFLVELAPEQLSVLPIHRLFSDLDPELDVLTAFDPWFEEFDAGPLDGAATISGRMADAGALGAGETDRVHAASPAAGDVRRGRRPRLEPPRRRPVRARRARDRVSAWRGQRRRASAVGRRRRWRAAPSRDGRSDRRDRAPRQAHASEDDVLRPEAQDRHRVPDARLMGRD